MEDDLVLSVLERVLNSRKRLKQFESELQPLGLQCQLTILERVVTEKIKKWLRNDAEGGLEISMQFHCVRVDKELSP